MTIPIADEEPMIPYDVTCETEDCENAGYVIRVLAPPTDPNVVCGPCGEPITNITAVAE